MLHEGDQLGGYRIRSRVGEGGLSAVYEVLHEALGSRHALKVLEVVSPEARARLLHEGRAQARVRHPNLVGVTDVISIADRPALVLEFVDGPTLEAFLAQGRPPLDVALTLFRGIVRGVEAAHEADLAHRDLKPANVLLAPAEGGGFVPKVADFGLARALDETETDGAGEQGGGRGTPPYMAPEQHRGEAVDERADLFALGCILYELVTGVRAFDGTDLIEIASAACERRYRPPEALVPDLPPTVVAAIRDLLHPRPERRLQSCAAVIAVLDGGAQLASATPSADTLSFDDLPGPLSAALQARRSGPRRIPVTPPPPTAGSRLGAWVVALSGLALLVVVGIALSLPSVVAEPTRAPTAVAPPTPGSIAGGDAPPLPTPEAPLEVTPSAAPPPAPEPVAPVVVPVAAPVPVVARVPVAARPAPASLTVAGDAVVEILDPSGAVVAAGELAPGTWRYRAALRNADIEGTVELAPGEHATLTCSTFAQRCRVTR